MGIGRPLATSNKGTISGDVVTKTTSDMTLYVRTDGDDSNDGLTESTALATIQEAVDQVPKHIQHDVTIDVGEGTFDGFGVSGFHLMGGKTFLIQGVMGTPTLTSGSTSGTAIDGDNWTIIDTNQNWTTNELEGMFVIVEEQYYPIHDNTATQINLGGRHSSSLSGKSYEIVELKTVLNTACGDDLSGGSEDNAVIGITNNIGNTVGGTVSKGIRVQNFEINLPSGGIGAYGRQSAAVSFMRLGIYGNTRDQFEVGIYYDFIPFPGNIRECFCKTVKYGILTYQSLVRSVSHISIDNVAYGCFFHSTDNVSYDGLFVTNANNTAILAESGGKHGNFQFVKIDNCNNGLVLGGLPWVDLDGSEITNCTKHGIVIGEHSPWRPQGVHVDMSGAHVISNCGKSGIYVAGGARVRVNNVSGTGNGEYGVHVDHGGVIEIASNTTITGDLGDGCVGDTAVSWSSDFASDRDAVVDPYTNAGIFRRDTD